MGRRILAQHPGTGGSLGCAISEAVETASRDPGYRYVLGSVLNQVLLHQSIIGLEAKAAFEKLGEKPDLIILDNQLPDGCGLDFCKELRRASDIPVIMISAEGGITGETDALKQGVNVYLRKPYAMEELLYHVERLTSTCPAMTL